MEAALVSVATGVLKPVLEKLAALLGDKYKRFKGVRKEIKSLTHELAAMEAFLLKMSEDEDPDEQDKVWMNEVRELSYDLEDAIDDFMQSIGDNDEKSDGFTERIKSSLGKLGKMKARHRIGKEIQDLKKQIKEVGERNARYKSHEAFSKTVNATVDPRALAIFEHASKLVGIDEPKAEIIKLLTEEDVRASEQEQQQPKIVSIVGSGGMGKTTLANQVYQELKGQYECRAFVSVSRNPDIINILRTILSEVARKDYGGTQVGSAQQLISKITDFLEDKRELTQRVAGEVQVVVHKQHRARAVDCSELEDHHLENIVRLFQLRYLNLKGTQISKLPEQIGRLGCLEMLDLRDTCVRGLPASIVNLRKLSHLLVHNDIKYPHGIAKMQALETLQFVTVSIQPVDILCGLGQLMNLRNLGLTLDFVFGSDAKNTNMVGEEHKKAIVSSLCKLGTQNLRFLNIEFGRSLLHVESLCLPTLEQLSIRFSAFPHVPTWVASLRNLQWLRLGLKVVKQDDLCVLGALPSLLILHLHEETESNEKLRISGEVGFRFLKIFIYCKGFGPVDLMFGTGSMPKLEKLEIHVLCIVEANSVGFGIENLPCLTSVKCLALEGDDGIVQVVKSVMERAASTHPNHPSLLFGRI
ncbi:hypothetical protein ZWY2020_023884 [Hordeum vulgare]|nr:hypothetical protein ZWY2020_023884 [Hordeum vulgare]